MEEKVKKREGEEEAVKERGLIRSKEERMEKEDEKRKWEREQRREGRAKRGTTLEGLIEKSYI